MSFIDFMLLLSVDRLYNARAIAIILNIMARMLKINGSLLGLFGFSMTTAGVGAVAGDGSLIV